MSDERDPYAILGVTWDASAAALSAAYRSQARRHHPDVSPESGSERRMAELNVAWAILRDPVRRAAWNREHGLTQGTAPRAATGRGPATPASGPRGRTDRVTWRRGPDGEGAAGPPPGNPRGSVLAFGRHIGWSLGEIARVDPGYLQWLAGRREGAPYRDEIEALVAVGGTRNDAGTRPPGRRPR